MSIWTGQASSDFFRVKDLAAFEAWAARHDLEVHRRGTTYPNEVYVTPDGDYGAWPTTYMDDDPDVAEPGVSDDDEFGFDVAAGIATFLDEGSIAILFEAGSEGTLCVTGTAEAIDHTGKRIRIDLHDVYAQAAAAFGVPVEQLDPPIKA